MPRRFEPLVNQAIYHVFNKTISSQRIFEEEINSEKFLDRSRYYRSAKARISFSRLNDLEEEIRDRILKEVKLKKYFKIEILAYALMPTHFHFLLRQVKQKGIEQFIGNIMNSFTKYINIRYEKLGPIFLPRFKSVKITTDQQAVHVTRYIHLNPYSSGIIKNIENLNDYKWSSYLEYVGEVPNYLCDTEFILELFNNDRDRYEKFVLDNADYQKSLELIKHVESW